MSTFLFVLVNASNAESRKPSSVSSSVLLPPSPLMRRRVHMGILQRIGTVPPEALLRQLAHRHPPLVDLLGFLENTLPGLEGRERNALPLTVRDQILAGAGKQQVCLARRAQIAHPVARVQQRGSFVVGHFGNRLRVRSDGQALVVPEPAVVVELDGPAVGLVETVSWRAGLGLVRHDFDVAHQLLAQQMLEECLQHGNHARTQHNDRHLVGSRPDHEVAEVRVERDVLAEDVEDLREWQVPRIKHLLERVAEGVGVVDHGVEELAPCGIAHAIVVGDEVVGVLEGDGAVEVGEEDHMGFGVESLGERHGGQSGTTERGVGLNEDIDQVQRVKGISLSLYRSTEYQEDGRETWTGEDRLGYVGACQSLLFSSPQRPPQFFLVQIFSVGGEFS